MILLSIILIIYSIVDIVFLTFLFKQYKLLIQSEEYTNESLLNKFILGCLAVGGMMLVFFLLAITIYYIFNIT